MDAHRTEVPHIRHRRWPSNRQSSCTEATTVSQRRRSARGWQGDDARPSPALQVPSCQASSSCSLEPSKHHPSNSPQVLVPKELRTRPKDYRVVPPWPPVVIAPIQMPPAVFREPPPSRRDPTPGRHEKEPVRHAPDPPRHAKNRGRHTTGSRNLEPRPKILMTAPRRHVPQNQQRENSHGTE